MQVSRLSALHMLSRRPSQVKVALSSWAGPVARAAIVQTLVARGISIDEPAASPFRPEAASGLAQAGGDGLAGGAQRGEQAADDADERGAGDGLG